MVVETRYAAGAGVLLGTDERWLLLTDPDDEQVVERLWSALGDGPGAADRVLDIVEAAFGGEPPALVLVDLTPGADQTVSLGAGRVRRRGRRPAHLARRRGHPGAGTVEGAATPLHRRRGGRPASRDPARCGPGP